MKTFILLTIVVTMALTGAPVRKGWHRKQNQTVQTTMNIQLTFVNDTQEDVPAQYGQEFVIPPGIHKYQFVFNPDAFLVFGTFPDEDKPTYQFSTLDPAQMQANNQCVCYYAGYVGAAGGAIQFDNYFNAPFEVAP